MADAITQCDLEALYAAIVSSIQAEYASLVTVEFDRLVRDQLPLPACLLEITEAGDDKNPGSGQQAYDVRFEARFIIGFRSPKAKLEIRKLALAFGAFLTNQGRWKDSNGVAIGGQADVPRVIGCYPDDFDPVLDQFEVWRVEWHQCLWFGDSVWANPGGITPSHVFVGVDPNIGAAHEADYVEVTNNG